MFYCSNAAGELRGSSYHCVHLTAKEMEAEMESDFLNILQTARG